MAQMKRKPNTYFMIASLSRFCCDSLAMPELVVLVPGCNLAELMPLLLPEEQDLVELGDVVALLDEEEEEDELLALETDGDSDRRVDGVLTCVWSK